MMDSFAFLVSAPPLKIAGAADHHDTGWRPAALGRLPPGCCDLFRSFPGQLEIADSRPSRCSLLPAWPISIRPSATASGSSSPARRFDLLPCAGTCFLVTCHDRISQEPGLVSVCCWTASGG
jgi:hypothetical protein